MMELNDILKLVNIMERSSLKEFYYKTEGEEIRLTKEGTVPAAAAAVVPSFTAVPAAEIQDEPKDDLAPGYKAVPVRSPYVGSICLKAEGGKPFVSEGDHVEIGQLLCKIEAMKMFSDIKSPVRGTLRKILMKDGELAELDSVLFEIEEDA